MMLIAVMGSGCATIATGTDQGVRVVTEKNIDGASCILVDSKGHRAFLPRTPGTTYLPRGDGPATVTCRKADFKTTTVQINEGMAGATLGNVILGGAIGIVMDAASGAAQRYPDQVFIWMEPEHWPDEQSKLQWEEDKRAHMQ